MIVFDAHDALTPAGKPLAPLTPALLMPVAPVVVRVILVKAVLIQSVGLLDAVPAVFTAVTVMVPVAFKPAQPVSGML